MMRCDDVIAEWRHSLERVCQETLTCAAPVRLEIGSDLLYYRLDKANASARTPVSWDARPFACVLCSAGV